MVAVMEAEESSFPSYFMQICAIVNFLGTLLEYSDICSSLHSHAACHILQAL